MRELAVIMAVLLSVGSAALAQEGPQTTKAPPIQLSFDLPTADGSGGPEPSTGQFGFRAATGEWQPGSEVSWQRGALGLGFREENGRIKGGAYLESAGWRLDLRPLNNDNVLDTNGVTLRLSTKLGD